MQQRRLPGLIFCALCAAPLCLRAAEQRAGDFLITAAEEFAADQDHPWLQIRHPPLNIGRVGLTSPQELRVEFSADTDPARGYAELKSGSFRSVRVRSAAGAGAIVIALNCAASSFAWSTSPGRITLQLKRGCPITGGNAEFQTIPAALRPIPPERTALLNTAAPIPPAPAVTLARPQPDGPAILEMAFASRMPEGDAAVRLRCSAPLKFTLRRDNPRLYVLELPAGTSYPSTLSQPHFPPQHFAGLQVVVAENRDQTPVIKIGVEQGVRLEAAQLGSDIWLSVAPRGETP